MREATAYDQFQRHRESPRLTSRISYEQFKRRYCLSKVELLALSCGTLIEDAPEDFGLLPAPPLLMFDRITELIHDGSGGRMVAEQDVALDAWYFLCHFRQDPVQPGCLGVDAVWQMLGLYLAHRGATGNGRALGVGGIEFNGQIRPYNRIVRYEVKVLRALILPDSGVGLVTADATVWVDGEPIYVISRARAGTFRNIRYVDYPLAGAQSVGGSVRQ